MSFTKIPSDGIAGRTFVVKIPNNFIPKEKVSEFGGSTLIKLPDGTGMTPPVGGTLIISA